ncbi:MAG: hypothetical protein AB8B49_05010 [Nitratireductor sp.]
MNWQTQLQLIDLEPSQKLEVTCKQCGHSRYEDPQKLITTYGLDFAYLDEVAKVLTCQKRGCSGAVRIALSAEAETEGFVGGLA